MHVAASKRKTARRIGLGVAALCFSSLLATGTASADSPVIQASGGDCRAWWSSSANEFGIRDADNNDNDWCYVDYSWQSDHTPAYRLALPQDEDTRYHYFPVNVNSETIYWKVCKERSDDPDVCSSWRADRT
ncbi:hypothetical protein ACI2L4_23240 [Streptomyces sparsogenes]|uniref:hypothetical protein n=1 Tax=Streptomyces sparsogenes TaxID=67365 RepID=UPI003850B1DC